MRAVLILCLGLQSAAIGADDSPATRTLHVFVEDATGTLLVDGWSVRLGRLSGTTMQWLETTRVDATSGVAEFAAIDEPTNFVQAMHDTGEIALRRDLDADGRYVARGVEPGSYRIELRDARYLPVLLERHMTGRAASMQLIGSATVVVEFVDAVDSRPLTPLDVYSLTKAVSASGRQAMQLLSLPSGAAGAGQSGATRLEGVVPGATLSLQASFARHLAASLELTDIAPAETRRITCRVDRARTVYGTILDPTGAPVAGVPVAIEGGTSAGSSTARAPQIVVSGPVFLQALTNGPTLLLTWGMTLAHFELTLQVGEDAALHRADKQRTLVDEHQTMQLRAARAAPCRLVVWRRGQTLVTPLAPRFAPPSQTYEFVPRAGAPTVVRVDLTPFAETH